MSALPPKADALTCIRIENRTIQFASIRKTGQPDKSPQIEAIRGKPRIAIFLLITNSEASGTQKRKDGVMRSKHFLLLVVLFIAGTTNAAFAQHAHMGGFAHLRSLGGGLTGPATTSGFHPNIGFGSSSAGGSGGTPTGLVRSSIRHEPFWDWGRRALIPLRSKPRP